MTAPIIKWAGGKTKLLPDLCKRMPREFRMYYEPFFGGGALFFHQLPQNAVVSDINPDLYSMYLAVAIDVEKVIPALRVLEREHNRKHYEWQREQWNKAGDRGLWKPHKRAALFIYLNKTCFNGLWRVNKSGQFNVPIGDYAKGHVICDEHKLRAASRALLPVRIRFGDYWHNCSGARDGDFVYFDPPYDPVSMSANFTSYASDGFGRVEQEALASRADQLAQAGARVMVSNSDTRFIRKLYRAHGFTIHKVSAARSINSDAAKRGKVAELIMTKGY